MGSELKIVVTKLEGPNPFCRSGIRTFGQGGSEGGF